MDLPFEVTETGKEVYLKKDCGDEKNKPPIKREQKKHQNA
jgi:hypothetical protein